MESKPDLTFEDTAVAFAYKSDDKLRKANFIFSLVNHPWMSFVARTFVKGAFRAHLPVEGLVRRTAFEHFCGGESIEECEDVIQLLGKYGVETILDYSVEGEKSEAGFDDTAEEILRNIEKANRSPHIPFCVFKTTGLASAELLEKMNGGESLTAAETLAFERVRERVDTICKKAHTFGVPILIDAEETWIQGPIDQIADDMMGRYNREKAIVFNTYQMYRTDAL